MGAEFLKVSFLLCLAFTIFHTILLVFLAKFLAVLFFKVRRRPQFVPLWVHTSDHPLRFALRLTLRVPVFPAGDRRLDPEQSRPSVLSRLRLPIALL